MVNTVGHPLNSNNYSLAYIKKEGAACHPDDMGIEDEEHYERQLRAYLRDAGKEQALQEMCFNPELLHKLIEEMTVKEIKYKELLLPPMKEVGEYTTDFAIVSHMLHIARGFRVIVEVVESYGNFRDDGKCCYDAALLALAENGA